MTPIFQDRLEAGHRLAEALAPLFPRPARNLLVLGLPRGGVPVAHAVAQRLGARLDVMLVRKLGVPGHDELAMGAIADGGSIVLNDELIDHLGLTARQLEEVIERERRELIRRAMLYRGTTVSPPVRGARVIVVDDGMATGSTMRVALRALRQQGPQSLFAATPVAPTQTVDELRRDADRVIAVAQPEPFIAVGLWYRDFRQTSDEEVRALLNRPDTPERAPTTTPAERSA
jgi:putative phosphoribosyl transferase